MKKKLALGLALVLACGTLAGCGGSSEEGKDGAESGATTAKVIDVDLTDEEYAFGVDKDQPELLEQANAFIAKVLEDGTFDEICDKYFGDGEPEAVQSAELDTSKDQLVVATNAAFEPFEYTQGDNYYGIDMEQSQYSKTIDKIPPPDIAISMGCDVGCPYIGREFDDHWGLPDPTGQSDRVFVDIIKETENRIKAL